MVMMFTDLVNSTGIKAEIGAAEYGGLVARQDRIVHGCVSETPGAQVLQDTGDGFFITFPTVGDAIACALRFQFRMHREAWPHPMAARVGIHLGQVAQVASSTTGQPKVFASSVDMTARVMSLAAGGQILMTRTVFDEARQFVHEHPPVDGQKPGIVWVAHGPYLFKGADEPMEVYEVGAEGDAPLVPPEDNEKARRHIRPGEEQTLGWRPGANRRLPNAPHWVIRRKLGEGGFGEVWLAEHDKTHAKRVFKFCFDAERLRALKREVVLFRLLKEALGDRRDIGRVVDWQFESAPYFIEMDYAPEGNLTHWAESQGGIQNVKLGTRLRIVAQVAEALDAAHSVGILHKDIKPSNVLMVRDADGALYPRLTDFGIGTLTDRNRLKEFNITAAGFTSSSLSMMDASRSGTLMYSPPETMANKPHTVQGDIYALGVMLYQMVVMDLHRPLAEGWERDVKDTLLREDIAACVDGDPANRPRSAKDVASRLLKLEHRRKERREKAEARQRDAEVRKAAEESARLAERRRRLIRVLSAGVGALVVIAGLFAVLLWQLGNRTREAQTNAKARTEEAQKARAAEDAQRKATGEAEQAGALAKEAAAQAEAAEAVKRRALTAELVAHGMEKQQGGNPALALPYFVRALAEVEGKDPAAVGAYRARIAATLAQCTVPWLVTGATSGEVLPATPEPASVALDGRVLRRRDGEGHVWVIDDPSGKPAVTFTSDARINHAALSPDGQRVVTCGADKVAALWDARTGRRLGKAMLHDGPVTFACFSADGARVLTGGEGRAARVWDATSGEPVTPWLAHRGAVTCGLFAPDGRTVVTGGRDNVAIAWNVADGKQLGETMQHPRAVVGMAFAPGTDRVATICEDHAARIWDLATTREVGPLLRHQGPINSAVFSRDGTRLVTAGDDNAARVWDARTGAAVGLPLDHPDHVMHASFSGDGQLVATACRDATVQAWRLGAGPTAPAVRTGMKIQHRGPVRGVVFAPDDRHVVSVLHDWGVFVWSLSERATPGMDAGLEMSGADFAAFDPDGASLIAWQAGGQAPIVRSLADPKAAPVRLAGHGGQVTCAALGPGSLAATGHADKQVILWDAESGKPRGEPLVADGEIHTVVFARDGGRVLAATRRGMVWAWDINSGNAIVKGVKPAGGGRIEAFSADGAKFLAITPASGGGEAAIAYDLASGAALSQPMAHPERINHAEFSPDGRRVVTASKNFTARVWGVDSQDGVTDRPLRHTGPVLWASFSPDGRRVVTAGYDHVARVWDVRTGEAITGQMRHPGSDTEVRWAGFSPDGSLVGTATNFYAARLWDAHNGQPVTPWLEHAKVVTQMSFAADSRRALTIGEDRRLRVWSVGADDRPLADLQKMARLLSGRSLDEAGGEMPLSPEEFNHTWRELAAKYPAEFAAPQPKPVARAAGFR